jgi:hypothetical protein
MRGFGPLLTTVALIASAFGAFAQTAEPEKIPFEGGTITITEKDSGEKEIAFDGRLLASNYSVFFDGQVDLGGAQVALISVPER